MGIKDEMPEDIRDSLEKIEAELKAEDLDDPIGDHPDRKHRRPTGPAA